jgi:hypothetical protein
MRALVVEGSALASQLLRPLVRGRSELPGLCAAAPLPRRRRGAVLLFESDGAIDRWTASREWNESALAASRTARHAVPPVRLDRPVFILGAPRSGTTLLFETLAAVPEFRTVGAEGHGILDGNPQLRPPHGRPSNRLVARDATPEIAATIRAGFVCAARSSEGELLLEEPAERRAGTLRLLEKTPRNALRVPFLRAIFPDARFIFLHRDPRDNVASLIEGWISRRFVSYELAGGEWSFLLPPGWQSMLTATVAERAAFQWRAANEYLLRDLPALPNDQWCAVRFDELIAEPARMVERLCRFCGVSASVATTRAARPLPWSASTLTPPRAGKWRAHADVIAEVFPSLAAIAGELETLGGGVRTDCAEARP